MKFSYPPSWNSIRKHQTPQWFRDAKFGIYTHWGIYSVPAKGPNATWYPYNMYRPGTAQYEYHVKTYGGPEKFGYKDFISEFTEKSLMRMSGRRYSRMPAPASPGRWVNIMMVSPCGTHNIPIGIRRKWGRSVT